MSSGAGMQWEAKFDSVDDVIFLVIAQLLPPEYIHQAFQSADH